MPSVATAKAIMKLFERHPSFSMDNIGPLQEVFNHSAFLDGSENTKKDIMLKSSNSKYENELAYSWDNYFSVEISSFLRDKVALDLGCFNGGRSVAWFERYQLKHISGVDVQQEYIDAADQFAAIHKISANFKVGFGEALPFEDNCFDAILTFDVFEHVRDPKKVLDECYRVLKDGGRLFLVFPGYFHPLEHHYNHVTMLPFFHYFFSSETLIQAYYEILKERGEEAYWYKRSSPKKEKWERGNTVNGTTVSQFKNLIKLSDWKVVHHSKKPLGSIGRLVVGHASVSRICRILRPLTSIPGLQEIFLHRITYILEKTD